MTNTAISSSPLRSRGARLALGLGLALALVVATLVAWAVAGIRGS